MHNTVEDKVIASANKIFADINNAGEKKKFCTCDQCRMDVSCYALNRLPPFYIVSNRGASRVQNENFDHQQQAADIVALIYEGLKRVSHNQRPNIDHSKASSGVNTGSTAPVYNVPAIMGRIFNGTNFAPLSNAEVELLWEGKPVVMKDANWQNPCRIVSSNEGNYSFWPVADPASGVNKHKVFDYTVRVSAPEFETLTHFFKIPVASEIRTAGSFTLERTFKLPDLYMFPPGEAEQNG